MEKLATNFKQLEDDAFGKELGIVGKQILSRSNDNELGVISQEIREKIFELTECDATVSVVDNGEGSAKSFVITVNNPKTSNQVRIES